MEAYLGKFFEKMGNMTVVRHNYEFIILIFYILLHFMDNIDSNHNTFK